MRTLFGDIPADSLRVLEGVIEQTSLDPLLAWEAEIVEACAVLKALNGTSVPWCTDESRTCARVMVDGVISFFVAENTNDQTCAFILPVYGTESGLLLLQYHAESTEEMISRLEGFVNDNLK